MKKQTYLMLLCLMVSIGVIAMMSTLPQSAHAQLGCEPIGYGQQVNNTIDNSVWGWSYCFAGSAGDSVQISMSATSGDLDTYLSLAGPDGFELTANDDREGNTTDSFISYTLPSTGNYSIYAGRYEFDAGITTGGFQLSLNLSGSTDPAPQQPAQQDRDGDGIPDADDFCPDTFGSPSANGCVPDIDGDGFDDDIDQCPDSVGVAPNGCPPADTNTDADRDGDGVSDTEDACPDVFGHPNNLGCIPDLDIDGVPDDIDQCIEAVGPEGVGPDGCPLGSVTNTDPGANRAQLCPQNQPSSNNITAFISYNDFIDGAVDPVGFPIVYCFDGRAGDRVVIAMEETGQFLGAVDSALILEDSNGNQIAADDNSGTPPLGAKIELTLPSTGPYRIIANPTQVGEGSDTFQLTLRATDTTGAERSSLCPRFSPSSANVNGYINFNETINGELRNEAFLTSAAYCFEGNRGDAVTVELTNTGVDELYPVLRLDTNDANGVVTVDCTPNCGVLATVTMEYTLPYTGVYRIVINPINEANQNAGNFDLRLTGVNASGTVIGFGDGLGEPIGNTGTAQQPPTGNTMNSTNIGCTPIAAGQTVSGTIDNTSFEQRYCFSTIGGENIQIIMQADVLGLDTYLELIDPLNQIVASNDDADASTTNSSLQYTVVVPGTYTIRVTRFQQSVGDSMGSYTLTVIIFGNG